MKRLTYVAALAALAVALPASANEELAKKHACFACHAVDKKLVGPAYKDVAAKYRNDKGAEARLVESGASSAVLRGSANNLNPASEKNGFSSGSVPVFS